MNILVRYAIIFILLLITSSCVIKTGTYTITEVLVTDEIDENGNSLQKTSIAIHEDASRSLYGIVHTEGIDTVIGMRWYLEDTLVFEKFARTRQNRLITSLDASPRLPLPAGNYRLDVHTSTSTVVESVHFVVKPYFPSVVPAQPTPQGHTDIEYSSYMEVPFAFDEVWTIEATDWHINEAKVVFLRDTELFVVVVITDMDLVRMDEEEIRTIAKPIGSYAVSNGYLALAEKLVIDGKKYDLSKDITVTLLNPDLHQIHRIQFALDELNEGV